MNDFIFAESQNVHALWGVLAFLALLILLERRSGRALERFASALMLRRLVRRPSPARRLTRIALLGLSGVFLVGALMRPQWGLEFVETPRAGTELMVCLDVSKSMLARDTAPNRLERAKAELVDLLSFLEGDHVGLTVFAGKATVVCPLTPDFGFFRMVLDEVGPHSVPLGGTNIADALKKASEGFGETADVSRAILLITDGEDHDEFAIEAAEAAEELGIQIIAIGFGDEVTGSEITLTDPETGAETLLRDGDGNVVRTKLNGDLLRGITLNRGAYIPAGTGVLDLESIYHQRLASLTRGKLDGRGRQVRKEGYQWAVLLAFLALVASVIVGSRAPREEQSTPGANDRTPRRSATRASAAALTLLTVGASLAALALPASAWAQSSAPPSPAPNAQGSAPSDPNAQPANSDDARGSLDAPGSLDEPAPIGAETPGSDEDDAPEAEPLPDDPREAYNLGLTALESGALETAEEHFTHARTKAGVDVQARFRATYNLAWTHVKRADTLIEEKPEEALTSLETAADWFRVAVRIFPANRDARHNLEVVLARALALRDQLAPKDERDYHQRLDELIERQRELQTRSLELIDAPPPSGGATDPSRAPFRALSKDTRLLLSDLSILARDAGDERETIATKGEEERTPEESVRAIQIENTLHYLNTASQRLQQSRRQLRLGASEGAFRRSALALGELKRARDQWRNPAELLSTLLQETQELGQLTGARAAAASASALGGEEIPGWLSPEFLEELQTTLHQRTEELHLRLTTALENAPEPGEEPNRVDVADPSVAQQQEQQRQQIEQIREAEPFVGTATRAFAEAIPELQSQEWNPALQKQGEALVALTEALERFSDLRRLIEAAYRLESSITKVLEDESMTLPNGETAPLDQVVEQLMYAQRNNLERADRIEKLIAQELAKLPEEAPADPGAAAAGSPNGEGNPERQRYEVAQQLLTLGRASMTRAEEWLAQPVDDPAADLDRVAALESSQRAVTQLEQLRRLFFTLIEHLKDTAYRQSQLGDETSETAGLLAAAADESGEEADALRRLGPLVPRQAELRTITDEIAKALDQQATAAAQGGGRAGGAQGLSPEQQEEQRVKLMRAAELVRAAEGEMGGAHETMSATPPDLDVATKNQHTALQQLVEAILLLEPPQQQEPQEQNQESQDQNEQQPSQPQEGEEHEQELDVQQLLQAIRDREAERRKEQAERTRSDAQKVEKDW